MPLDMLKVKYENVQLNVKKCTKNAVYHLSHVDDIPLRYDKSLKFQYGK